MSLLAAVLAAEVRSFVTLADIVRGRRFNFPR